MIATGIIAIGPGVGRGLISLRVGFGPAITITDSIEVAIPAALLIYDIYKKKNYKPSLLILIVFLIGGFLWQIRATEAWQSFAKAYASLLY
jgi:hypothetical protein